MEEDLLKNEVWLLVRNISEGLNSVLTPVISGSGLTLMQFRLLMACSRQTGLTVSGLSQISGVAAANVSAMCKRLEGMGFLQRIRDQEDERVVHILLTEQGRYTLQAVDEAVHTRYARLFSQEPPEEIERIIDGLQQFNALLQRLADVSYPAGE